MKIFSMPFLAPFNSRATNQPLPFQGSIFADEDDFRYQRKQSLIADFFDAATKGDTAKLLSYIQQHQLHPDITNAQEQTALIKSAIEGHVDLGEALLNLNANVNAKDTYGMTGLMWAAYKGHCDMATQLIEADADINMQDNQGETALTYAATVGCPEMVALLLEAKADKTLANKEGETALSIAKARGYDQCVALLTANTN